MSNIFECSSNLITKYFSPKYHKPLPKTLKEWNDFHEAFQSEHPNVTKILNYIEILEDVFNFLPRKLNNLRYAIKNKYFKKYYTLNTGLNPSNYYDLDTRILFGLFNELVKFIEIECAYMQCYFSITECKKYKLPWYTYSKLNFLFPTVACPEAGIDYLNFQIVSGNPEYSKILNLYHWWKNIRPNRIDAYEFSDIENFYRAMELKYNKKLNLFQLDEILSPEEYKYSKILYQRQQNKENEYYEEDTKMLTELIQLRELLWT